MSPQRISAICPQCSASIVWTGSAADRPACPTCGHVATMSKLAAQQLEQLERTLADGDSHKITAAVAELTRAVEEMGQGSASADAWLFGLQAAVNPVADRHGVEPLRLLGAYLEEHPREHAEDWLEHAISALADWDPKLIERIVRTMPKSALINAASIITRANVYIEQREAELLG